MMTMTTTLDVQADGRTMTLTRDFAHPRERVWAAYTESGAIARWYGPHGFTTEVVENEIRSGGRFHYVMRDADGGAWPVIGRFVEVVAPERIVSTDDNSCMPEAWLEEHAADLRASGASLENVAATTFAALDAGRTRLRMQVVCPTERLRVALLEAGMAVGIGQSFEKLDALLAGGNDGDA